MKCKFLKKKKFNLKKYYRNSILIENSYKIHHNEKLFTKKINHVALPRTKSSPPPLNCKLTPVPLK